MYVLVHICQLAAKLALSQSQWSRAAMGSHCRSLGSILASKKVISYDFRHLSPSPPIVEIVQIKQKKKTRKTEFLKGKLEDLDI